MKVIGVVGPAGSGKSTVCRMLSRRPGIIHVNADELAWATYHPGGPAYARIVARFGEGVLGPNGTVDRDALGRLVFSDPKAKADLEAIVHPLVMGKIREIVAKERTGTKFLLVEGALLLASPHVDTSLFDAFVWLSVSEEERRRRLLAAGLLGEVVEHRLFAQRDLAPKIGGVFSSSSGPRVYVIDGHGPPAAVARRFRILLEELSHGSAS